MNDQHSDTSLIDEWSRRRFEQAWREGLPEPIDLFLPPSDHPSYLPTLEELVQIELEFAWQATGDQKGQIHPLAVTLQHAPIVEDYLQRFAELQDPAILMRLIQQEHRVRVAAERAVTWQDYRQRFPELPVSDNELAAQLAAITNQLQADHGRAAQQETARADEPMVAGTETQTINRGKQEATIKLPMQFGHYELLNVLGRGGMGVVYQARQLGAERFVALKVIRRDWLVAMPDDARNSALDRFQHEAQAAAKIEHPNIVRVYEVGDVDGEPFFSMQFVEGKSLAELTVTAPLAGERAARLLESVARAVDEAHRRGILHRDLKPQNILVDQQRDAALVADFGLAKLLQSSDATLTCAGDVVGSPPYMSPEQAHDSSLVTTQSDVYALGATLYHAVTGRPPFEGPDVLTVLAKVINDPPRPLRQVNAEIDPDLETICLKCLEKEPGRRYLSAAALADDLRHYVSGEPIAARPVGSGERLWLWCRRNPLVATLMGTTLLFVALTFVASLAGYVKTSAALSTANRRHRETRQVINDFFTRVSQYKLLNEPGMQPLRKELLQSVLPYYQRFLVEFGDDPEIRDELASTHFRIGLITETIGGPQDAFSWYDKARNMQAEMLAEQPNDRSYLQDYGNTMVAIGRILQLQSMRDDARRAYQQAVRLREHLVALYPDDFEARRMLANCHMNLGTLEKDDDSYEIASQHYEQAQAIRQAILDEDPRQVNTRRDFGKGAYNQAVLAVKVAGEDAELRESQYVLARRYLQQAIAMFEQLLHEDPRDLGNQQRRVRCYRMLADLEMENTDAISLYEQALEGMEVLAVRNPDVPEFRGDLAVLHMMLGRRLAELGTLDLAEEHLTDAQSLFVELVEEYPDVARYRSDLAVTLQELALVMGDIDELAAAREYLIAAREHFLLLVKSNPDDANFAQGLAGVEQLLQLLGNGESSAPGD